MKGRGAHVRIVARVALAVGFAGAADGLARGDDGAQVQASLAWVASDRLDLVGTIAAEAPLAARGRWQVFTSATAVTAIARTASDFTFLVDRLRYSAAVGARRTLGDRGAFEVVVSEQGRYAVDATGRARVRSAGVAWERA